MEWKTPNLIAASINIFSHYQAHMLASANIPGNHRDYAVERWDASGIV